VAFEFHSAALECNPKSQFKAAELPYSKSTTPKSINKVVIKFKECNWQILKEK